jgi:N-acetylglucosaminyldiphosphoundecaprenol N-acetyl-beta-D-mannosaminyltransferase
VAATIQLTDDGLFHQVVTINPEFVMTARRDLQFRRVLGSADIAVADGMGIVWAARILGDCIPERVGGVEILKGIAALAAHRGKRVFLLGAEEGVAAMAAQRLVAEYPGLQVAGTYAGSPRPEDALTIISLVRAAHPDLLFVAFGAPAQDLWIAEHQAACNVPVAMGVGGAFDYLAGRVPRAPGAIQRAGFEWLYRLIQQPWRWRRMLALPKFGAMVIATRLLTRRAARV